MNFGSFQITVLSPPCGMATKIKLVAVSFGYVCSEPTVWDGDPGMFNENVLETNKF